MRLTKVNKGGIDSVDIDAKIEILENVELGHVVGHGEVEMVWVIQYVEGNGAISLGGKCQKSFAVLLLDARRH